MDSLQALKTCVLPLHHTRILRILPSPMSKGIASRNSLKALAHPLQQFLAGWGEQQRPGRSHSGDAMPPLYALAAIRGEAVLRQRFFSAFIAQLPLQLEAQQQLALWQDMVEEGGLITDWVQRLGISKALRREAALPELLTRESRQLYTLLLHALEVEQPTLLPEAVEKYFLHCWRARFPATPQTEANTNTQATVLRQRLTRQLSRHHGEPVQVKESFTQTANLVQFSLLAKSCSKPQWETLIALERPRLKSARLAAYHEVLSDNQRQTPQK